MGELEPPRNSQDDLSAYTANNPAGEPNNPDHSKSQPVNKYQTKKRKKRNYKKRMKEKEKDSNNESLGNHIDHADMPKDETETNPIQTHQNHKQSKPSKQAKDSKDSKPTLLDPPDLKLPHLQSPNLELDMPVNNFEASPGNQMSPRRQAIMRYKKSDDHINKGSIINQVKGNLKSNSKSPKPSGPDVMSDGVPNSPKTHVDEKISLFKFKSSRILVFDEVIDQPETGAKSSSGRLLGHGEFEIFQLHNGDVTYLACGTSFIYPLLPKLKILRIAFNHFILPLVNPDRYWKILINSDDINIIKDLENTLDKVVQYRDLAIGAEPPITRNKSELETPIQESLRLPDSPGFSNNDHVTQGDSFLHFNLAQISNNIPDTPPSAPLSPHNPRSGGALLDGFQLDSPLKPPVINTELHKIESMIPRDNSNKSISSALASFEISKVDKAKSSKKYSTVNPYQKASTREDEKSESSLDSLLDEYEESMSVSKSFTYSRSRAQSRVPSRPISRTSSFIRPPINYSRGDYFLSNLESNDLHDNNPIDYNHSKSPDNDMFPTTSLSEYNKTHNMRSRRSSRSELYTSESNWMEPNPNSKLNPNVNVNANMNTNSRPDLSRITNSRSSYSVSSQYQGPDHRNSDLNSTYKQIYKSITQRNLAQITNDRHDDSGSVRSYQRLPTIEQSKAFNYPNRKYLTSSTRDVYDRPRYGSNKSKHSSSTGNSKVSNHKTNTGSRLNSEDVYKMLSSSDRNTVNSSTSRHTSYLSTYSSSKEQQQRQPQPPQQQHQQQHNSKQKQGIASRLFGW